MGILDEGFFNRLKTSVDRVLFGLDLILSASITFIAYYFGNNFINSKIAVRLFDSATPFITTLIIVIVTSVSILVSLSNSSAISQLKKDQLYEKFLFTFEFTAILAIITVILSVIAQTFEIELSLFYAFLFLLAYTVFAVGTVISRLITYGDKIAQISLAEDLPDDLDQQVTEIHPEDQDKDVEAQKGEESEVSDSR